jgi:hypothetical protein
VTKRHIKTKSRFELEEMRLLIRDYITRWQTALIQLAACFSSRACEFALRYELKYLKCLRFKGDLLSEVILLRNMQE